MTTPETPRTTTGSSRAPGVDVDRIRSIAEFKNVAGAALGAGAAEGWSRLGNAFQDALDRLKRFQQGFSADVDGLRGSFRGTASTAFHGFADEVILKRSQAVSAALAGYPGAMAAIARSITFFQAHVAEIEAEFSSRVASDADKVAKVVNTATAAGLDVDGGALMRNVIQNDMDNTVMPELRRALLDLIAAYQSNGQALTAFDSRAVQPPRGAGHASSGQDSPAAKGNPATEPKPGEKSGDDTHKADPAAGPTAGATSGGSVKPESAAKKPSTTAGADSTAAATARQQATQDAKKAADKAIDTLSKASSPSTASPTAAARQQALSDAKKAVDQALTGAADTPTTTSGGPTGDTARQRALADAKQTAGNAIDALRQAGGSGAGTTPERAGASPTTIGASGTGLGSSGTDAARQQALQDAKRTAQDAISALQGGGGALGGAAGLGAGGAGFGGGGAGKDKQSKKNAAADKRQDNLMAQARKAADKALTGLMGSRQDPARTRALQDAQRTVDDALKQLQTGQSGDPQKALQAARHAADQAVKGLQSDGNTSPARQQALADAKGAVDDALRQLQASQGGPSKAQNLSGAGIKDVSSPSGSGSSQGVRAAQAAAQDAIRSLQSGGGAGLGSGGGSVPHTGGSPAGGGGAKPNPADLQGVREAQATAQDAIKALQSGGGSLPQAGGGPKPSAADLQGVRAAQAAAQDAIDTLSGGGLDKGSSLASFLGGAKGGGGGLPGLGGGGLGGSGLDGLAAGGGSSPSLDATSLARQQGYDVPGATTASSSPSRPTGLAAGEMGAGSPMPPPMMGGGAAGGQGKKERERTTWLQGDPKDWQDDDTCASRSTLGRG